MYLITLAYDGTHYFGWQKTQMGPSIQGALEKALHQITREDPLPEAASRTDRGVHAEGQVVAFFLEKTWDVKKLQKGLNAVLPPDIRVRSVEKREIDFHPTLHAKNKEYHYRLCLAEVQHPHQALYAWHFHLPVQVDLMKKASLDLLGTHDFSAFVNKPEENPLCTLTDIQITPFEKEGLQISLQGNRFLYKMARNLVGTLLYIGCGKIAHDQIPSLLAARDRKQIGMTAPAHGLFLHRVDY